MVRGFGPQSTRKFAPIMFLRFFFLENSVKALLKRILVLRYDLTRFTGSKYTLLSLSEAFTTLSAILYRMKMALMTKCYNKEPSRRLLQRKY